MKEQLTVAEGRKTEFERANGIVLDDQDVDQDVRRLTALAQTSMAPSSPAISVGASNPAATQIAQLDAAISTAERTLGPNNPQLLDMKRQRAALAASAAAPIVATGGGGPSIGSQYSAQLDRVLAKRGKSDEARRLAVEVAVLREQYQKASTRVAELQQQADSVESGLTLLGAATAPDKPTFPNWPLIIFGSLGLGLILGVLAAILAELLARRVRCTSDLRFNDLPILGEMAIPTKRGDFKILSRFRKSKLSEALSHG